MGRKLTADDCKVSRYNDEDIAEVRCRRSGALLGLLHSRWRGFAYGNGPHGFGVVYEDGSANYHHKRRAAVEEIAGRYRFPD